MKKLLLLVATISTLSVYGQDQEKKILIGINISPDYCYRTLDNTNGSYISSIIIDMRDESEEAKFGYTGGLNICYILNKHISLEAGLQYSNKGYAIKNLFFGDQVDPRYGYVYNNSGYNGAPLSDIQIIYNYHYLDVPVRAIFSFGKNKIHFLASAGITTNFLLEANQTNISIYEDGEAERETQKDSYDYNAVNFSPAVSVGIDYNISNKIKLSAEPTFRYGLLKISDTPVTSYLWSGGLNISCYYTLK